MKQHKKFTIGKKNIEITMLLFFLGVIVVFSMKIIEVTTNKNDCSISDTNENNMKTDDIALSETTNITEIEITSFYCDGSIFIRNLKI